MEVPFVDLRAQYESIRPQLDEAMTGSVMKFNFIGGESVSKFEKQFRVAVNSNYCISTGNCTDALFAALKVLGVGPGDEVITPAFTWISSAETISLCHATPVFVDVDPQTYTIDPAKIEEKITTKTKGIILVHLYGQAAHASVIRDLCLAKNFFLIEDCAQAHFTREGNKYAGTFGDAGAFSFYPTKNLGAYGDAGCLITDSEDLAIKTRRFVNHGALKKDDHLIEGFNSRMDSLQAAVLLTKLPYLNGWNAGRRVNGDAYNRLLSGIPEVTTPYVRPGTEHTFHLYVIRCERRNELRQFLESKGIQSVVHYPAALPNLPAYRYLNHSVKDFPVASLLQHQVLSLPVYPELSPDKIEYVCESIKAFYSH